MAEIKTKPTAVAVDDFIDAVEPAQRREDAKTVCAMMERLTGEPPRMWGPTIVGFGEYHYKYESGHEGDMCRMGFSPRKSALTIYLVPGFERDQALMERLGKHKHGKSCLYINKLSDIDLDVLEALARDTLDYMEEHYPRA
ncbi:MAG: DUF1801 domain-containing protein [Sphingomonadaceae bacterium]|nr:DUF1801 domain-containing protein [Sphingomonadaceae bacterium]